MAPVHEKSTGQEPQDQPDSPTFPARMGYGLYALSPGTGVLAPVIRALVKETHEFGISTGMPGPHDFAVRIDGRSSNGINASTASRAQRP
jgi:hypothetical protein